MSFPTESDKIKPDSGLEKNEGRDQGLDREQVLKIIKSKFTDWFLLNGLISELEKETHRTIYYGHISIIFQELLSEGILEVDATGDWFRLVKP